MLYKFKSKAAGDLIMLEPNGRRVLEIIGKDAAPKGIIQPEQMQGAISALEAAIAPYRGNAKWHWQPSEPSLEDVFIDLMGRSKDNFQG